MPRSILAKYQVCQACQYYVVYGGDRDLEFVECQLVHDAVPKRYPDVSIICADYKGQVEQFELAIPQECPYQLEQIMANQKFKEPKRGREIQREEKQPN